MVERDERVNRSMTRREWSAARPSSHDVPRSRAFVARAAAIAIAALLALGLPQVTRAADGVAPALEDVAYRLPFAAGREVRIGQGWHGAYSHVGRAEYAYDFVLPDGLPVLAAASGTVSHAHAGETTCGGRDSVNAVNFVTIDHADGTATLYGHLSRVDVAVGDVVEAGQPIGLSGRTGFTNCNPHLHFSRQVGGRAVTQSLPISFVEYPDTELVRNQLVVAAATVVEVTNDAELASEMETRLDAISRSEEDEEFEWLDDGPPPFGLGLLAFEPASDVGTHEPHDDLPSDVIAALSY